MLEASCFAAVLLFFIFLTDLLISQIVQQLPAKSIPGVGF